ncbi:hypothetical protein ACWDTT_15785 [Streptosporangium sandarakinum]
MSEEWQRQLQAGTCLESAMVDGYPALCTLDKDHTKSADPKERQHYDKGGDRRWTTEDEEK